MEIDDPSAMQTVTVQALLRLTKEMVPEEGRNIVSVLVTNGAGRAVFMAKLALRVEWLIEDNQMNR